MKKRLCQFVFLVWLFIPPIAFSQSIIKTETFPDKLDIYLVIGQSNMAGRAEMEENGPLENVYLLKGEEGEMWVPAMNPLNLYSTIRKEESMQKLSPAYQFAKDLKMNAGREIGLVVNARGGTALAEWMPGSEYYREAIHRVKLALPSGTLKGIIWHQGESDVDKISAYLSDLSMLIESFRRDLGDEKLPFVAGQLSEDKPERKAFNKMILDLPKTVPYTAVVSSKGTSTFDETHFDTPSQLLMGKRYAKAMRDLLPEEKPLFSFGLFADTQYADVETLGKRNYRRAIHTLENTVEAFNKEQLSWIISLGDLIDRDFVSFDKPLRILEGSKAPRYHVLGNHDFSVEEDMKAKVPALLDNPKGYHSFEKEGFLFMFLNGMDISLEGHKTGSKAYQKALKKMQELESIGADNAKPWNGGLGSKQLSWLRKQLKTAEKKGLKTLIFCHYPLLPENGLQLWDNREIVEVLNQYSTVKAYFSGHHHEGNYVVEQGIHYLTVKGMVESLAESSGYIILAYPDRLKLKGMGEQEDMVMEFTR